MSRCPVERPLLQRPRCVRATYRIRPEQRGGYYGTDLFHICFDALAKDFIRLQKLRLSRSRYRANLSNIPASRAFADRDPGDRASGQQRET